MKSFKSFDELSKELSSLRGFFETKDKFLAHTHQNKPLETLHQHIEKVNHYFLRVIQIHNLEGIIDQLVKDISFDNQIVGNYLKEMFLSSIILHDFGKINPNFQAERMKNRFFVSDSSIKIGYEHSFLSAYMFIGYYCQKIIDDTRIDGAIKAILFPNCFLFAIPMLKHHSGYIEKDYNFEKEKTESVFKLLADAGFDFSKEYIASIIESEKSDSQQNLWTYYHESAKKHNIDHFSMIVLLKLNYSLLTASDYYATSDYMNNLVLDTEEDFGLLTKQLKKQIAESFENNPDKPFNKDLLENLEYYKNYPFENLQEANNTNLNILRQKLGAEVLIGIENQRDERVFYIEAPTGGGKTNMSMIAIYKLLQLHPEITKIFYVFPFTTLITQTINAVKQTFGLTNEHVTELHSKSGYQTKNPGSDSDAAYGKQLKNQIDNLFVNYPFTLLTHIRFFDILKSNEKKTNYILHRLANSVVVIDELQAYDPKHWDKMKFFISKYAKTFNIRFIIMSATLPKINNIALDEKETLNFTPLIENAVEKYLQNPNFSKRVTIKTELLSSGRIEIADLARIVFEKSQNYSISRKDKFNGSVFSLIEFIFKKSATEFYNFIRENGLFDDYRVFVLSGTIIEPRRKYIINYLKDEKNRNQKVLLITTQVVEAGVDIDMDLGFKNQSLIDSDEQLAGRINRNVNKKDCELYLFDHDKPGVIYGGDERYKVAKSLSIEEKQSVLQEKRFDFLYDKVMAQIEKNNKSAYKKGFDEYKLLFKNIDFRAIHQDFKLIDNDSASVFVPLDIPVFNYEFRNEKSELRKIENNFSQEELRFITKNNCMAELNDNVSGEKIWLLYKSLVQNNELGFGKKEMELKILNGIMSKFVFSIFPRNIDYLFSYFEHEEDIQGFKQYAFYKLRKEEKEELDPIYSLEGGLNTEKSQKLWDIF